MNCESNNIVLLHSQFASSMGTLGTCNDGAIIGWSVAVDNGCFTSQLNVTVNVELEERYIECVYDDGIHPLSIGLLKMIRLKGLSTECNLLSPKSTEYFTLIFLGSTYALCTCQCIPPVSPSRAAQGKTRDLTSPSSNTFI